MIRKALLTPLARGKAGAGLPFKAQGKPRSKRGLLVLEEVADFVEDFGVHGGGDAAGLGILLAGVVNAKQARSSGRDFGFGTVSEFEARARRDDVALLEDVEVAVPGDFA